MVSEAINKYSSKNDYAEFGPFGEATSIFVCGRAMQNSRYQPFLTEIRDASFIEPFLDDVYLPADKRQAEKVMKSILNNALMLIR